MFTKAAINQDLSCWSGFCSVGKFGAPWNDWLVHAVRGKRAVSFYGVYILIRPDRNNPCRCKVGLARAAQFGTGIFERYAMAWLDPRKNTRSLFCIVRRRALLGLLGGKARSKEKKSDACIYRRFIANGGPRSHVAGVLFFAPRQVEDFIRSAPVSALDP